MGKKRGTRKGKKSELQWLDAIWPIDVGMKCPDNKERKLCAFIDVFLFWTAGDRRNFTVAIRGRQIKGQDEESFELQRGTPEAANFIAQLDLYSMRARAGQEEEAARFINQFGFRINAAALRERNAGKAARHA